MSKVAALVIGALLVSMPARADFKNTERDNRLLNAIAFKIYNEKCPGRLALTTKVRTMVDVLSDTVVQSESASRTKEAAKAVQKNLDSLGLELFCTAVEMDFLDNVKETIR
jgi:hypothetical protein